MSQTSESASKIKVICENCSRDKHKYCSVCGGSSYYYWDPESLFCYNTLGKEIQIQGEDGKTVNIIKKHLAPDIAIEEMIEFINLWVLVSPQRKWKLWADNNGWHSSIWFNYNKKERCDCTENCYKECIATSYRQINQQQ